MAQALRAARFDAGDRTFVAGAPETRDRMLEMKLCTAQRGDATQCVDVIDAAAGLPIMHAISGKSLPVDDLAQFQSAAFDHPVQSLRCTVGQRVNECRVVVTVACRQNIACMLRCAIVAEIEFLAQMQ